MIGRRLKIARVKAGFTQAELGVKAGLDEESASARISSYENEVHAPNFSFSIHLAIVLDVPAAYFYTEDNELAEIILQYHKYKKQKPHSIIVLSLS